MAIKPPSWAKGAVPTPRGWMNPRTKEILKVQKISQVQIDEFYGKTAKPAKKAAPVVEDVVDGPVTEWAEQLNEAPPTTKSLDEMNKLELEALGRQHDIELDRRKNQDDLVEELEEHLEETADEGTKKKWGLF